jgi:hypothetical protein
VSLVRKQQAELVRLRAQLSNLLAVIYRDGGHYEQQHGTEVAVQAAIELVVQMQADCGLSLNGLEEAKRLLARLRGQGQL